MKIGRYKIICIIILFLAALLRFYNYDQRWLFGPDQARDVMIARSALEQRTLPMSGSLSSAGPFTFGPHFYQLLMLSYLPNRDFLLAPWILFTCIDIALVLVMIGIGKELGGNKLSILLGVLSAISTSQINRANNLTQHTLVAITAALSIYYFIKSIKTPKLKYFLLLGGAIGLGISMHSQAINLLLYGVVVFVSEFKNLKNYTLLVLKRTFILAVGYISVNAVFIYWDVVIQNNSNIINLLDFFLIGQYRFWVSNRWLTYLSDFWPTYWGGVIGGYKVVGMTLMLLVVVIALFTIYKKIISKEMKLMLILFIVQVLLNRYYRGERFEGYLLYFHPLVLLFTGWALWHLYQYKKYLGGIVITLVIILSLIQDKKLILATDNMYRTNLKITNKLLELYPGKKFEIYEYITFDPSLSQSIVMDLAFKNKIAKGALSIGIMADNPSYQQKTPIYQVVHNKPFYFYTLDKSDLANEAWKDINPWFFYEDYASIWKQKKLKSTFSLSNYILEKIGLRKIE